MSFFCRTLGLLLALLVFSACQPQVFDDPIPVMLNREKDDGTRLEAARQAAERFPGDQRRISALNELLYGAYQSTELRRYAVDQLLLHDQANFRGDLDLKFARINDFDAANHIMKLAVDRGWTDFTRAAVRRYAIPMLDVPDDKRPERDAVSRLNPGQPIEKIVWNIFASPDGAMPIEHRISAWILLNRLVDQATLHQWLPQAPDKAALITDLKAASSDLGIIPRNGMGIEWLYYLRDDARKPFWTAVRNIVARLTPEQKNRLELRHLSVLLKLDEATFKLDRQQLLAGLEGQLRNGEHHIGGNATDTAQTQHPQTLAAWADKLCWADLAAIRLVFRAVQDRQLAADFFAQADEDYRDSATERGGVLDLVDGRFAAAHYLPLLTRNNRTFVPRAEMVERLYTAIGHYHFHAQLLNNEENAGPGEGDLDNADRWNLNFLVFTFIDRNRLNVDYYQSGRAVVDLGTIRR